MGAETEDRTEKTVQPYRENVLVRDVDGELYRQFCKRAASLGVSPESVFEEIVDRGMSEWLQMRSQ